MEAKKKPKSKHRGSLPYNMISNKSPLLNKNEIEKREIFKEIVNDFPYAEKQKRFVESVYKEAKVITDEDLKAFRPRAIRHKQKIEVKRTTDRAQPISESRRLTEYSRGLDNSMDQPIHRSSFIDKGMKVPVSDMKKTVYISSRISKCIESMLGDKIGSDKITEFNSKFDSPSKKLRLSIEGNNDELAYKSAYSRQSKNILHINSNSIDAKRYSGVPTYMNHLNESTSYTMKNQPFGGERLRALVQSSHRPKRNKVPYRDPGHIPIACTMKSNNSKRPRLSSALGGPRLAKNSAQFNRLLVRGDQNTSSYAPVHHNRSLGIIDS